jgi:O-acetyl-ADP-ribose deacetylase (regulator of RNase III)
VGTEVDFHFMFRDVSPAVVDALKGAFEDAPWCTIERRGILNEEADAIVSPANSLGIMDGGIDLEYSLHFGWELQDRLQTEIQKRFGGFLPVGAAVIVPTNNLRIPWLISAPTMEMPQSIDHTRNVYRAMRGAIQAVRLHNLRSTSADRTLIHHILTPGMGTGVGQMDPENAARQMRQAIEHEQRSRSV